MQGMASRRVSAAAVVKYFNGDESFLPEVFMEGSDDDLGMEDEYSDPSDDEETVRKASSTEPNGK